jgi:hypothetical protein
MDENLKAKLDEARKRMNSEQAGINANRKHDDPSMREWARGKQRPANSERAQLRNSLTDAERRQIEQRIEQLAHENPHYIAPTVHWSYSLTAEAKKDCYRLVAMLGDVSESAD